MSGILVLTIHGCATYSLRLGIQYLKAATVEVLDFCHTAAYREQMGSLEVHPA